MSEVANRAVTVNIPELLRPLFEPKRFKIMYGGRGGGKSHGVAQALILYAMQARHRILCVREVQKSLRESSMQVIVDYINRLELVQYFEVLKTEIRCKLTGSSFSFTGLQDHTADTVKSFEGATLVWAEEGHSIKPRSWNILIPTILRTSGAEIWVTLNPDQEDDYIYKRFINGTDRDAWTQKINWRDNHWFNSAMNDERLTLKSINNDLYEHVWEGACRSKGGVLFKRAWFKRYAPGDEPEALNKYVASDYAGAPDADNEESNPDSTEHGVAGLDENGDMWFVDWWSGQVDPSIWIAALLALLRRHKPLIAFEEKGVILRTVSGAINKAMREASTHVYREGLASVGNKASRALGFAARAAAGTVWVPNTEWGDRLVNQLCSFNGVAGRADDMVDVCSLLARGLDSMSDATLPHSDRSPPVKPFSVEWLERSREHSVEKKAAAMFYR